MSCVGKTVCVIARESPPPTFIAAAADKDTMSCRVPPWASASTSVIRYGEEGWARVLPRFRQPQVAAVERIARRHRRQIAAAEKQLERAAQAAELALSGPS